MNHDQINTESLQDQGLDFLNIKEYKYLKSIFTPLNQYYIYENHANREKIIIQEFQIPINDEEKSNM